MLNSRPPPAAGRPVAQRGRHIGRVKLSVAASVAGIREEALERGALRRCAAAELLLCSRRMRHNGDCPPTAPQIQYMAPHECNTLQSARI